MDFFCFSPIALASLTPPTIKCVRADSLSVTGCHGRAIMATQLHLYAYIGHLLDLHLHFRRIEESYLPIESSLQTSLVQIYARPGTFSLVGITPEEHLSN
ncbi:unnamed protein product [Periconia digitata]|uniref:Uncharacterized protein n=1 Tax=Periconia digitata TaxID=1303443 RepID=A0A9W4U952_9PLEO|nr:unnamed protein product [Periconia digitata]